MNKINLENIKSFLFKKRNLYIAGFLVVAIVGFFMFSGDKSDNIQISQVKFSDLSKNIQATGQVISKTDLNLSFNKTGTVKSVKVNVGDIVKTGQILATLDQGQAGAVLTQAKGALLAAKAKYNKILQGASNEEIVLAEIALKNSQNDFENVKNAQNVLVSNAYQNLLNSNLQAYPTSSFTNAISPTISGTYILGKEGDIKISLYQSGNGGYFNTSGVFNTSGSISYSSPQALGDSGLYIQFPTNYSVQDSWVVSIPNKQASNYLTNYNAYQNALKTQTSALSSAQSLVDQKQAELNLKKANARQSDIDLANADILSAEGNLESAQSAYEDTIIRAPADGTITKIDIKYGEISQVGKAVISLQDISNLYIEALINEANIANLKIGQNVSITFDAFGKDKSFTGVVSQIDPSAETNNGVVNYKIKILINEKDETIRPGMNANVNILAGEKNNVLAIPNVGIIQKDGKYFVDFITNIKSKKYIEREVQTGFIGDNNMIEIVSGLSENDQIALIQNK
ncbi:efflux RND transporter periplasmic adaptor subunit [Candidatus Nomurabacteria bacterium]|nr:efflux RND transporter periplasmic adaptor subunit [Candidatus Nomurabacteria bacterium]